MKATNIVSQLKRDEGLRLTPYVDTVGKVTVGYGHNLTDSVGRKTGALTAPITLDQAEAYLISDIDNAKRLLAEHLPWTPTLDDTRLGVLINLTFNMGIGIPGKRGLLAFTHTLSLIQAGNYSEAADELLRSKWATQVKDRATRLSTQLRTGEWV